MEPKGFGDIGTLDHVDDPADGVKQATTRKEQESVEWDTPVNRSDKEHDDPAHDDVAHGIDNPRDAVDEDLCQDSYKGDGPDDGQKDNTLHAIQYIQEHRSIASCNQDIDHAVVKLLEEMDPLLRSGVAMVDSTGKVKQDHADAEYDASGDVHGTGRHRHPLEHQDQQTDEGQRGTGKVGQGIYGFSQCDSHISSSCSFQNYFMSYSYYTRIPENFNTKNRII